MMIRRIIAAVLLVASVVAATLGHRSEQAVDVMVANRDLNAGMIIGADDVRIAHMPPGQVPEGALRMSRDGTGRTVTGPVHRGEVMTDWRVLSPRLPLQLTGDSSARLVPVRLADESVMSLVRAGDVVDVLTETQHADVAPSSKDLRAGRVLARSAIVAVVPAAGSHDRDKTSVVLLAMNADDAHTVATTALSEPVAVVFH